MSDLFISKFPNRLEGIQRFELAKSLYYYQLEKIIRLEKLNKPHIDLRVLLDKDELHTTLIACCVEIVLDAYNSQLKFPWILETFSIKAFNFYKIIEIVVRGHEGILTRALIKHLNYIEETCLESLAWQKTSPLWELKEIKANKNLPTCSDVDVSNNFRRIEVLCMKQANSAKEFLSILISFLQYNLPRIQHMRHLMLPPQVIWPKETCIILQKVIINCIVFLI